MFYTGESLLYIGVQNNDTLETIIVKINQAFQNAGVGYAFTNGLIQPTPFQPVQLGGALIQNTTIGGNFTLSFTGNVQAARHITTGGSSSQFLKGDGTLDSTAYQPAANYITGLSGDATASGPGVAAMTLATVNFSSGTFGNGNTIPIVTVNAKGLVTNITPVPITLPPLPLTFIGDVVGSGFTGSNITLLLQNVNPNPYNTITPLKFSVNGKGLVTSASPITASDIVNILGYYPGTSGTTGTSGTSGTTGTSGTSGTSGSDGTSGTSGTTGTSGTSATSGTSGTSGTDGTGGTSGTSGSTGTSGSSGTSGSTGTSGTSGTTGTSGSSGTSGSTGTSGSSGTTGTSGSSGTTGTSGSSGTSGTTGTSGSSGTSGTTGTSGTSGLSGDRFKTSSTTTYTLQSPGGTGTITVEPGLAYTVAQSVIISYDAFNYVEAEVSSYDSITGVLNFIVFRLEGSGTYNSWFVNIDGASGGDGSSGSSGTTGTSGSSGTSGTTGTSGSSGTSGTTGTSGSSGTSGTSATDGTGGTSGTSGSSGTSGTTGTSGTSATSGTSGTSATSGTTGTSGTSGTNGTGGTSGTSGSSATSGTSGTSGVNGAPGASGTSGTSGTSVAVSGTTNTMAKFTSSTTIGNSALTDDGSTLSYPGSLVMGTGGTSYVRMGRFPNSVTNTGEAWIGRASDRNVGTMTVQLGGNSASGRNFEVVDYAWSVVLFNTNSDGNSYSASSFRAPIFYDVNDTNYYIDGASTSVLNALNVNSILVNNNVRIQTFNTRNLIVKATTDSDAGILGRGSGDQFAFQIYGSASDYGFLNSAWGSWDLRKNNGGPIYLNNQSTYYYDDDVTYVLRVYGTADMRSPLYYDLNDTAYYTDPNGISSMYGIAIRGDLSSVDSSNQIFFWGGGNTTTSAIGFKANGGSFPNPTGNGDGYNTYLTMDSPGRGWVFRQGIGGSDFGAAYTSGWILNNGIWQANNQMRAPIYFDSANTAYYLDPSSISSLRTVGSWRADSAAWDGEFSGKIQYHSNHWYIQAADLLIYRNSGGSNVFTVDQSGNTTTSGYFRIAANTNLYLDNNYGQSIVGVYSSLRYQGVFAMGDAYKLAIDGTTPGNLYGITWSHPNAGGVAGNLNTHGALILENGTFLAALSGSIRARDDMRAPIFYDSNNTGYYLDAASTTALYDLTIVGASHKYLYINPGNGYEAMVRYNGGSGSGWYVGKRISGQLIGSDSFHFFSEAGGRTVAGIDSSGTMISDGSMRSPIFYDYNNTGYYLDPASTSLINEINLAGAINYTGSVSVDSGFGIYFSANRDTAYGIFREAGGWGPPFPDLRIAFHTGIKLGANANYNGIRFYNDYTMVAQVMSVNNASDPLGANNVYVNNNLMAGVSLRAPICYDSDNTNYYIDAAITSNLNAIVVGTLISNVGWLEVRSNVASTNPTTDSGLFFGWNKSGGNGEANIIVDGGANTGQFLFQRYNGGGSYTNIFQADIYGLTANSGTVSVFSDIRLKTNITNASPKLNDLMKLNVVNYEFVGEYNALGKQLGFIAQEVEQIFPSLVREQDTRQYDEQGNYIKGYEDTKILKVGMEFAMLVKAMQEQQSIIDSLKLEIETLKQKQL